MAGKRVTKPKPVRAPKAREGGRTRKISRREVLKAGVVTAVLTRTARAAASSVYLIRTTDRVEGIKRGLATLGLPSARGKRAVIKPNFNSADEFPASTHLDTLGALIRHLRDGGAREVFVADRSGMGDTRGVMQRKGVFDQEQIARAVQLGLGAKGPEQIDIVTDDRESKKLADRVRQILVRV